MEKAAPVVPTLTTSGSAASEESNLQGKHDIGDGQSASQSLPCRLVLPHLKALT